MNDIVNVKLIVNDNYVLEQFKILVGKKNDEKNAILGVSMKYPQLIAKILYSRKHGLTGKVFSEYVSNQMIIVGQDIGFNKASALLGF